MKDNILLRDLKIKDQEEDKDFTRGSKDISASNLMPRFLTTDAGTGGGPRSAGHQKLCTGGGATVSEKRIPGLTEVGLREVKPLHPHNARESKGGRLGKR